MKKDLLAALRHGEELTLRQQTTMALQLSIPAILAQLSSIAMQYIDSSMVGHLGREASAAIGLVASSTWLLMGLCRALTVGFCVQTAQRIGAGEERDARNLVKQSLLVGVAFGMVLAALSAALAGPLPHWLGAEESIWQAATRIDPRGAAIVPAIDLCWNETSEMYRIQMLRIPLESAAPLIALRIRVQEPYAVLVYGMTASM